MPTHPHTIIFGPFQPHLEDSLVAAVTALRADDPLAPALLLVGSNHLGHGLTRLLARRLGGVAGLRTLTFLDAARALAAGSLAASGVRTLSQAGERVLARMVSSELPADSYFARIAGKPGFEEALLATLRDLRDGGVAPRDLREAFPRSDRKIRDLADLQELYEKRLRDLRLIDRPGLLAAAIRALEPAKPGPTPSSRPFGASRLFVYGFYDFTWLQESLLSRLLDRLPATIFFPWQETPAFEMAGPTRGRLLERCSPRPPTGASAADAGASGTAAGAGAPTTLETLRRRLFAAPAGGPLLDPRDAASAAEAAAPALRIVSAPGEPREAREAVRAIADLARAGIPLEETALLYRSGDDYARLSAPWLRALGVPSFRTAGDSLRLSRSARALLLALDIKENDFEREAVIEFLSLAVPRSSDARRAAGDGSDPGAEDAADPADWDLLSRLAGIVSGRTSWAERLDRLASSLANRARKADGTDDPDADATPDPRLLAGARRLPRLVARLARVLDAVPLQGSWSEMARAIQALVDWLPDSPETAAIEETLSSLAALGVVESRTTLRGFRRELELELERAEGRQGHFQKGHLFVGDVQSARGLGFRAVVLLGLVEQVFPVPARQDPILLDDERARLNAAVGPRGGRVPLKSLRAQEERLLFALATAAARERLILLFPRLDPETARERVASSFLLSVVEAVTGRPCDYEGLEAFMRKDRIRLADLGPAQRERAIGEREFDLVTVERGVRAGDLRQAIYPATIPGRDPFFVRGLRFEARRWAEPRLTAYDGLLPAGARDRLAAHGLTGGPLSPTRLEQYMTCPFQYFCERILGLEPLEAPERLERLSALDKGTLMHRVLHEFFSGLMAEGRLPLRGADFGVLRDRLLGIARRRLAAADEAGLAGLPLLRAIESEMIEEDLTRVLEDEIAAAQAAGPAGFRPAHFEVRFGMPRRDGGKGEDPADDPISTDAPVPLRLEDDDRIELKGQIDRIDVSPEGREARVIDYKSGRLIGYEPDSTCAGTALQLPVYLLAAETLLPGTVAREAIYRSVSRRGGFETIPFRRGDWDRVLNELRAVARIVRDGVASGTFFHHPDESAQCSRCDFTLVCGEARQARFERKAADPAARPFLEFKAASSREGEDGGGERS